jgi:hypothetical protein
MIADWSPLTALPKISQKDIGSSRGFLRCQPAKWLPGFPVQWVALAHSLGIEIKVVGVTPTTQIKTANARVYAGKISDLDIGILAAEDSFLFITNAIVPGGAAAGHQILEEYLVRRLFASLIMSWSGTELSNFAFLGQKEISDMDIGGAVQVSLMINGFPAAFSILLSPPLIEMMDGMWRRQLRSSFVERKAIQGIDIDIAHLAVSPTSLSEYTSPGTIVDLEVPISDSVILRLSSGELITGRLRTVSEELVVEVGAGAPPPLNQPEGTSRVAVRLGSFKLAPGTDISELLQPGSLIPTGLPALNIAALVVGSERIGRVKICVYEQRFAMTVL